VHPTIASDDRGTQDNEPSSSRLHGNWSNAEGRTRRIFLIVKAPTDTTNVNMYHTFLILPGNQIGFDRGFLLPVYRSRISGQRAGNFLPAPDAEQTTISCDGNADTDNGLKKTDTSLLRANGLGPGSRTQSISGRSLYLSNDRGDTMTVVSQASISQSRCKCSPNHRSDLAGAIYSHGRIKMERVFAKPHRPLSSLVEITERVIPFESERKHDKQIRGRAAIRS